MLHVRAELIPDPDPTQQMSTIEQRMNLWHLATQVLAYDVPGEFVDVGCFNGLTSAVLATVLAAQAPDRALHLYDSFEHRLGLAEDTKTVLQRHFETNGLPPPKLHEGRFEETLPRDLPECVAFAQLDCGVGASQDVHGPLLRHCLEALWARLAPGAICVVQDYYDPARGADVPDYYPFIKGLVDDFLRPHGVCATALFSGKYSHGFFRKPLRGANGPP